MCVHTRTRTHTYIRTHACIHTHTHTHVRTRPYVRTHMVYTHVHTYAQNIHTYTRTHKKGIYKHIYTWYICGTGGIVWGHTARARVQRARRQHSSTHRRSSTGGRLRRKGSRNPGQTCWRGGGGGGGNGCNPGGFVCAQAALELWECPHVAQLFGWGRGQPLGPGGAVAACRGRERGMQRCLQKPLLARDRLVSTVSTVYLLPSAVYLYRLWLPGTVEC